MAAKIALVDIETAPTLGYAWETYDTHLTHIQQNWYMLSFAYKFLDEGDIVCRALPDYPDYRYNLRDDLSLVRDLWTVFDTADIIVAHNGDAFDVKKSNARFIANGLPPPSPYKTIDTLKIAKKHFKFESNKLDNLGRFLDVGQKLPHTGFDLWLGCMAGNLEAWRKMKEYNVQDTALLEEVYYKLRPWASTLPSLALYSDPSSPPICPACGSDHVQRRGLAYARTQKRQRFQCVDCSSWFQGGIVK